MATGALDTNGIWQYGEDDSEATFSALLNKLASSTSTQIGKRKVLQVQKSTSTSGFSTSSTSFVDSGVSITFTPISATSTLLVSAYFIGSASLTSGVDCFGYYQLTTAANATLSGAESLSFGYSDNGNNAFRQIVSPMVLHGVVASGSTGSRTYKLRFSAASATTTVRVRGNETTTYLVIQEVEL